MSSWIILSFLLVQNVFASTCDIYASGGTPCVAAHSTVRSLFSTFDGALYQVTRGSDNTTMDIYPLSTGGVANAASQDSFCSLTTCLITIIYDQSGNDNHLTAAPQGSAGAGPEPGGYDFVAGATGAAVTVGGHKAYGVFTTLDTGYRIDDTKGVATGTQAEGTYAVVDGTHYSSNCCFDYGNAETNNDDDGAGAMEALYFGTGTGSGFVKGEGSGPWLMVDMENGLYAGNNRATGVNPSSPTITNRFFTGMIKGNSINEWAIKGGNAQSGSLTTFFDGPRPSGYYPMKKQGSIILGIGGDNSHGSQGTFYEGALTIGYPTNATEASVQANIVSANYQTTTQVSGPAFTVGQQISIKSNSGGYIGHNGQTVTVMAASSSGATTFTVTAANNPNSGCYSFESVDSPGNYLRHDNYQIILTTNSVNSGTFDDDSSFCPESGFVGSGTSFRSYSYPTRWWRQLSNGEIFIGTNGGPFPEDSSSNFNQQASWTAVSPVS